MHQFDLKLQRGVLFYTRVQISKGVCVCVFRFFGGVDVVTLPVAVMLFALQVVVRRFLICIEELTNEL